MRKILPLTVLVIPVILAGIGIKLMRDSLFGIVNDPFNLVFIQFIAGLIFAILGIWFVGGYILNREKKNNRAKESFMKKQRTDK